MCKILCELLREAKVAVAFAVAIVALVWIFPPFILASESTATQALAGKSGQIDVWELAVQLGRLDVITLLLTVLAILLAVAAMVGFGYFTNRVEAAAHETADKVVRELAKEYFANRGKEDSEIEPSEADPSEVDIRNVQHEEESNDN